MTEKTPYEFVFMFPEGPKDSKDMTREDLLRVIEWCMKDRKFWVNEAKNAVSMWGAGT